MHQQCYKSFELVGKKNVIRKITDQYHKFAIYRHKQTKQNQKLPSAYKNIRRNCVWHTYIRKLVMKFGEEPINVSI